VKKIKARLLAGLLVIILAVTLLCPMAAFAADPTVTITVTAQVISITNSQDTWAIGTVEVDDVIYFSADGLADLDYSMVINTGNIAIDVEIQGEDIEGGDYDWTLAATAGAEQYACGADIAGADTYAIEVKSSEYVDLKSDLAASANVTWSMKFTAPSSFNADDDGAEKSATITLVASVHV